MLPDHAPHQIPRLAGGGGCSKSGVSMEHLHWPHFPPAGGHAGVRWPPRHVVNQSPTPHPLLVDVKPPSSVTTLALHVKSFLCCMWFTASSPFVLTLHP